MLSHGRKECHRLYAHFSGYLGRGFGQSTGSKSQNPMTQSPYGPLGYIAGAIHGLLGLRYLAAKSSLPDTHQCRKAAYLPATP